VRVSEKDVGGAGHIGAAGAVANVTHWAVLDTDVFTARIVHEVAYAAGAKVALLGCVVVAIAVAVVVITDAGVLAFVARCLVFDAVRGVVVDLGDLHLL